MDNVSDRSKYRERKASKFCYRRDRELSIYTCSLRGKALTKLNEYGHIRLALRGNKRRALSSEWLGYNIKINIIILSVTAVIRRISNLIRSKVFSEMRDG